jgi:hypothetical protein
LKPLTNEISSFLTNQADIRVTTSTCTTYSKYTNFLQATNKIAARLTPGSIFEAVAGRLMPQSLFEKCTTISDLVNAVLRGVRLSNNLLPDNASLTQVIMTTPVNIQNSNATSANPSWRTALWHLLMTGRWTEELGIASKTALLESWLDTVKPLKHLTPHRGCYLNEGHYLEPEWQETFYGPNYAALLEIKKYDPTHFFDNWKYFS